MSTDAVPQCLHLNSYPKRISRALMESALPQEGQRKATISEFIGELCGAWLAKTVNRSPCF